MKKLTVCVLVLSAALMIAVAATAPKTYQVTGSITALTDTTVSVQKADGEVWEIGRDASLAVTGGTLAVGKKVTVFYRMVGVKAEIKLK